VSEDINNQKPYVTEWRKINNRKPYVTEWRKINNQKPYVTEWQKINNQKPYVTEWEKINNQKPYVTEWQIEDINNQKPYVTEWQKINNQKPYVTDWQIEDINNQKPCVTENTTTKRRNKSRKIRIVQHEHTTNGCWTEIIQKGRYFLLYWWHPSCLVKIPVINHEWEQVDIVITTTSTICPHFVYPRYKNKTGSMLVQSVKFA
jgi:hypothetical protein